jgi:hypothetical protein
MSARTAAWLAWSLWAFCVPLATLSGLLGSLGAAAQNRSDSGLSVLFAVLLLTYPTVGAVVASRLPENPIGWILCAGGLALGISYSAGSYADYALFASARPLPGVEYAAWVSNWTGITALLLTAAFLFLLFPDGRLPSRLWRPVAWAVVIGSVISTLGSAFASGSLETHSSIVNPVGIGGAFGNFLGMLDGYGTIVLILSCFASMLSPVQRLRRARGQERQQIKWLVFAAALMVAGFVLSYLWQWGAANSIAWFAFILGIMLLPLAIGVAILRYRLYDIDRIINRTLVYSSLSVALALVYFVVVTATQAIFDALTAQEQHPQLVIVASTLAIAGLFNPLRRRVQAFVDRRFYRRKYDARKTLEDFSARLREETDLDQLGDEMVAVVGETMQPAHIGLWLRPDRESKGGGEVPRI